jgi:hypothetical protein
MDSLQSLLLGELDEHHYFTRKLLKEQYDLGYKNRFIGK